jgi:putative endonuclease
MPVTLRADLRGVGDGLFQLCSKHPAGIAQSWNTATHTFDGSRRSVARVSEDRRKRLGEAGEELAAQHLVRRGFRILERNYRTRWGELDIVAFDGATLAFVEVKSRRATAGRTPFESVHARKRDQVRRMAARWLNERADRPFARVLRFDAIAVTFDGAGRVLALQHLEGAF